GRRGQSHRMLQVKEIGTVTQRMQLSGHCSHDRDDQTILELRINRPQTFQKEHHSSHIRSRVRRRATGCKLLSARVCAWRIRFLTVSNASRKKYGIRNACKSGSVTLPPCVCHGSRSPKEPRELMSINRGILYRCAKDTIPLMAARKPWFCISMADLTPAKCAPAEMPTASSSFASRTRIISGSSSANRMRC